MFIGELIPSGTIPPKERAPRRELASMCDSSLIECGTEAIDYLKRDERTPLTSSASAALQAVRLASKLICVAVKFVASVL
jgi:hypothetical protein